MNESYCFGMQGLSFQLEGAFLRSVYRVAQNRMSDRSHMDPDLVGPAGLQLEGTVGIGSEPFQNPVMSHCPPTGRVDGHLLPVRLRTGNRCIYGTFIILYIPDDNSLIDAVYCMFFDLFCYSVMCLVVLADNEGAGRVPVNPVDDAGPLFPIDSGQRIPAVIENGVDQGIVLVSGGRMDNHALGLIYNQDVSVLIDNVQRYVLGRHIDFFGLRKPNGNFISGRNFVRILLRVPVYGDQALADEIREKRPGVVGEKVLETDVQTFSGILRSYGNHSVFFTHKNRCTNSRRLNRLRETIVCDRPTVR